MTGASASPGRLRFVTWNIRAAIGPGEPFPPGWWRHVAPERLAAIAAFIRGLEPDVVSLQEITIMNVDGAVTDQPADLAQLTGLDVRYGAVHAYALIEPDTGRSVGSAMWGNAILTREPLRNAFVRGLPRAADDDAIEPSGDDHPLAGVRYAAAEPGHREGRCVVGGTLAPMNVVVATTHLTYMGREQRSRQAAAAREFADAAGAGPLVLGGDFNAAIDTPELAGASAAMIDAFAAVGIPPGDDRRRSCGPLSIDHVLVRGLDVETCRVAADAGDLSDHWPVVADLAIA